MKKNIGVLVLFLIVFSLLYTLLTLDKSERVSDVLKDEEKFLDISVKQGIDRFHVIAENVYISMQNDKEFLKIVSSLEKQGLDKTHDALKNYLSSEFFRLRQLGVMGLHIVLPDNRSLLRMHKLDKYGDDLTKVRYALDYVNKNKIHIHGFEEGRTSHAFREVYPLFADGKYLGAMEVLFSSTRLQDYTMRAANIHTHFLVCKDVFEVNAWKSNVVEPYKQSIEHKDYLFSMNNHMLHKRLDSSNKTLITPLRKEIDKGIKSKKVFAVYKRNDQTVRVVTFLPVQRIKDAKTVAYIVSYTTSDKIKEILDRYNFLVTLLIVVLLVAYMITLKILTDKNRMQNELKYDALTNVYNRKYFMLGLKDEFEVLKKHKTAFTFVMADIDFFKAVNDENGHQVGDTVLVEFAKIFKESVRSLDKVARYGGEEFIFFLLTDEANAFKVIENIRMKVKEHKFSEKNLNITASFGIAEFKNDENIENVIKRADTALYEAKANGRDQTKIL